MIFKTKRVKELEELLSIYKEKNSSLENKINNFAAMFVPLQVPQESDMTAYWTRISSLVSDPLFLFYLTQLRREIVDRFEANGKDSPEFFRGMLTTIGQIFTDARKAQRQITGGIDATL